MTKQIKVPKTGLFIGRSDDGVQWFWRLTATNGRTHANNFGHDTAQMAIKSIDATRRFFKGVPRRIFNLVTGEYVKG